MTVAASPRLRVRLVELLLLLWCSAVSKHALMHLMYNITLGPRKRVPLCTATNGLSLGGPELLYFIQLYDDGLFKLRAGGLG